MKRSRIGRSKSKRMFSRGADRVNSKNFLSRVQAPGLMRGGIRL